MDDIKAALTCTAQLLTNADALLICAGAGMGVDSGLPDFRGNAGFWRAYPPYERLGLRFDELADPTHFAEDPALAWGFYGHRLRLYRQTEPHDGFPILRRWAATMPSGYRIFTSNVDGQFQRAEFRQEYVAEVHGSIHNFQCTQPCSEEIWSAEDIGVIIDENSMRALPPLPRCPNCDAIARPNILMFGDYRWLPQRTDGALREQKTWRYALKSARLVVLEIGAGTAVPTVRRHAELASAATGALIRINPMEPGVRHGRGISLPMGALDALSELDTLLHR